MRITTGSARRRARCIGRLVALVLALAATAAGAAARPQSELDSRLRTAVRKLEAGDSLGALLALEAVLSRDDEYWPAYYWRARVQAAMGDDLGAKASLLRAAELDPGNAELHFLAASVTWQLADFAAAWSQLVAAAQGGWDVAQVRQLAKNLRQYSDEPEDFRSRLAAPRVVLEVASEVPAELLREVRSRLVYAPGVALVPGADLAGHRLLLQRNTAEDGGAATAGGVAEGAIASATWRLRLLPMTAGAPLREWEVRPDALGELDAIVDELEVELAR